MSAPLGSVSTVLGDVLPESVGMVLPHEHLFIELQGWAPTPKNEDEVAFADAAVSLEILHRIHRRALSNRDNCRIDDMQAVLEEVRAFASVQSGTIVDVTPANLGRDPSRAAEISRLTGIQIVAGSGYYVDASHPPNVETASKEEIAEEILRDLLVGIANTPASAQV